MRTIRVRSVLRYSGCVVHFRLTVGSAGIADKDMLMLQHVPKGAAPGQSAVSDPLLGVSPQQLLRELREHPEYLSRFESIAPQLVDAIRSNNQQQAEFHLGQLAGQVSNR